MTTTEKQMREHAEVALKNAQANARFASKAMLINDRLACQEASDQWMQRHIEWIDAADKQRIEDELLATLPVQGNPTLEVV